MRKIALRSLTVLFSLVAVPHAYSQSSMVDAAEKWYIGINLNYIDTGDVDSELRQPAEEGGPLTPGTPARDTSFDADFDNGEGFGLKGGFIIGNWRTELEYRRLRSDINRMTVNEAAIPSGELEIDAFTLNLWYDLPWTPLGLAPYVGGGIGGADMAYESDDDSVTFGQLGVGLLWNLADHWQLDIGYRYIDAKPSEFGIDAGEVEFDYSGHSLLAGINFMF